MGIAIDFVMDSPPSSPRQNAVLIPELTFLIQQHLLPHDLAVASRVCRNWQEAWTPFLYYHVRYRHSNSYYTSSSFASHSHNQPLSDPIYHQHHQQHILPFLNLTKYGHWIKSLEVSSLIVSHHHYSHQYPCSSGVARSSRSSTQSNPPLPLVQDHLLQIQTCSTLNLTQLGIFKTVMSLQRLDELLSALPMLKVFKFEVVNTVESGATASAAVSLHSRSNSHGGSGVNRGYMQQRQSNLLLKKPERISLQGLEQEVVRVIARRLYRNLERLELFFSVTGVIVLSALEELLTNCGSVLKALSLTKAEIVKRDFSREWNISNQAEIAALLASLSAVSLSSPSTASPMTLSSHGTVSSSASSSSVSSAYSTPASPTSSISDQLKGTPVLESLSLYSCLIEDRDCESLLGQVSRLRELCLHDCKSLTQQVVPSILTCTPQLESLSLSTVPNINPVGLAQLFTVTDELSATNSTGGVSSTTTLNPLLPGVVNAKLGLQLKHVRLAYLRQLDDNVLKTLALHQGPSLLKLSLYWCPHVTDEGVIPILKSCDKLVDLSLCLSKPTLNIFNELTDPSNGAKRPWACSQTLERLEVGGQMFLDRIRSSNEHLQPQLYHHTSPNPHHIRNGSTPQVTARSVFNGNTSSGSRPSNIIYDPYTVAHYQGYPMYHLLRYSRFSDPFRELRAQLETLPRLTHLGIPAKGVEHLIKKGFGPKVNLTSLALLNQQGRVWSPEELEDLLKHMPKLRSLVCEKNTILSSPHPTYNHKEAIFHKQYDKVVRLLQQHNVELVQSSSSTGLCASPK